MGSGEREKGDSREGGRRAKGGRVERGGAESVSWRARSMSWERPRRPRLGTTFVPQIRSGGRECGGAKAFAFAAECAHHPLALRAAPQSSTTERSTPLLERGLSL
jgi:hypothetical protein